MPIEINPRWSASMELVERAHGVSVFGVHAAEAVMDTLEMARAALARVVSSCEMATTSRPKSPVSLKSEPNGS